MHRRRRAITFQCELRSRESKELLGQNLKLRRFLRDRGAGHNFQAQFEHANIVTNAARIGLIGAGASIVDQTGVNALANLATMESMDSFASGAGRASPPRIISRMEVGWSRGPGARSRFNGSFACVTNPANLDAGLFEVFGTDLGPTESQGNGLLAANGSFGDVNPAGDTLVDGQLTTYRIGRRRR